MQTTSTTTTTTGAADVARHKRTVSPHAPKSRVRLPWLLVATTAFLLAAVVVLWALGRAADRAEVLVVTAPVAAGEPITAEAVGTSQVALDDGYGRIYVASQRDAVLGAIAVVDLAPGDFLSPALLTAIPVTADGEQLVGAVLRQGRYPAHIHPGDLGVAVSTADPAAANPAQVPVRIVAVEITGTLQAAITMAVASDSAPSVGLWAGEDHLVVVVSPLGANP